MGARSDIVIRTADSRGGEVGCGISAELRDDRFPILVIDSKHAFAVRGANDGRGEADVRFEHGDGGSASRT